MDERFQLLYLDKSYDNPMGHQTVAAHEYTALIQRIQTCRVWLPPSQRNSEAVS